MSTRKTVSFTCQRCSKSISQPKPRWLNQVDAITRAEMKHERLCRGAGRRPDAKSPQFVASGRTDLPEAQA